MSNICPYPGLRPFTEEESIYFKGRDTHILQIITQLEQKKFLMLTGASGDGKSSLVYAGVIPNARAGFFKARFNNWVVADFRPERNPLQQLSFSLADHLQIDKEETLKELNFGFSSLVNLYKSSECFLDTESEKYRIADEKEKKTLKRKAANLLILADQFEEFFTNPENYSKGIPSKESQIVVNLLIETAKIALEQNLPIYIICTMRSDYIGQCASFRGLPEMIDFSQFFVPRLKRQEIHQVIEEPAILSGNKISNRLIETLINEMNEGFDQLPVMQHTLNALWNMAYKSPTTALPEVEGDRTQMDLIHLSKLAGISPFHLPKEDKQRFDEWFAKLPEFQKQYFKHYSLEQVLSAHSDTLYETAHNYFNSNANKENSAVSNSETFVIRSITKEETQLIIKTAFQCLTKIDEGRAVRNRMTLQEITEILNQENLTIEIVGGVLKLFREQGNTFISPFISEEPETKKLNPETVLDITHESLIRNWGRLKEWANEEHDNLLTFQDFNKQLQRWLSNNKSSGYLLPIGPLTYFENWFYTAKPNKYWLARYDESDLPREEKLAKVEQLLKDAGLFIKRCALNLFFSRTVLKYGAGKITAFIGLCALIIACTYFSYDYSTKQNDYVIEQIKNRGIELLQSNKVKDKTKAEFVINYERLHPNSYEELLNSTTDNDTTAFDIAEKMFWAVNNYEDVFSQKVNNGFNPLLVPLLNYMDQRLENTINQDLMNGLEISDENLRRLNHLTQTCFVVMSNNREKQEVKKMFNKNLEKVYTSFTKRINIPIDSLQAASREFNDSFQLLFALGDKNKFINLPEITAKLSPFENDTSIARFKKLFPKDTKWKVFYDFNTFSHNGGYQLMSYAYASTGNTELLKKCLDSVTFYNKEYKNYWYQNFDDVVAYLIKYNHFNKENTGVINKYNNITKLNSTKITGKIIKTILSQDGRGNYRVNVLNKNYSLGIISYTLSKSQINAGWDICYDLLSDMLKIEVNTDIYIANKLKTFGLTVDNEVDEYFSKALFYKMRGIYSSEYGTNQKESEEYFHKAFNFYSIANSKYLNKDFNVDQTNFLNYTKIKNATIFLYPDKIDEASPDPFSGSISEKSAFSKYIVENNLGNFYKTKDDAEALQSYLYQLYSYWKRGERSKTDSMNYMFFDYVKNLCENNAVVNQNINQEFLDLVYIIKAFDEGDTSKAKNLYEKLDKKKIFSANFQNEASPKGNIHSYLLKQAAIQFARINNVEEATTIIHKIDKPYERRNLILEISNSLFENGPIENSFIFMDLMFSEIDKSPGFGVIFFKALGLAGSQEVFNLASVLIKDVSDDSKPRALQYFIRGISKVGLYYKAKTYIPTYISSANELVLYNEILNAEILLKNINGSVNGWITYDKKINAVNTYKDVEVAKGTVYYNSEEE